MRIKNIKAVAFLLFVSLSATVSAQRKINRHTARVTFVLPDTLRGLQLYAELRAEAAGNAFYEIGFDSASIGFGSMRNQKYFMFLSRQRGYSLATGIGIDSFDHNYSWSYDWKEGTTYKFLMTAIVDSAKNTTILTSYVYLPEKLQWKLLVSYKTAESAAYLRTPRMTLRAGSENKRRKKAKLVLSQGWIQRRNGSWKQLIENTFETSKGRFSTGTDSGQIFIEDLRTAKLGDGSPVKTDLQPPLISVTNHIDSLQQTKVDQSQIFAAVASKKIDTTGSINGVYYNILTDGTGPLVNITDTLTVFYKGWLLGNGQVFDQTKDDAASFPLSRLIKGWQIGLTRCRVGGKIRLFIPSGLAYSIRSRSKDIPPNSVLVFDIDVKEASAKR